MLPARPRASRASRDNALGRPYRPRRSRSELVHDRGWVLPVPTIDCLSDHVTGVFLRLTRLIVSACRHGRPFEGGVRDRDLARKYCIAANSSNCQSQGPYFADTTSAGSLLPEIGSEISAKLEITPKNGLVPMTGYVCLSRALTH